VQREGDQIRVTAQLIEAVSNAHLWSERWDRPSKEFFAVQSEIADQVGNRLGGSGVIDKAEQEAVRRSRPENLTAYEIFLAGRSEHIRMTLEGAKNAVELLEKAVATDPKLARAWAELAGARQSLIGFGEDASTILPAELAAAQRAVDLDPGDALAHSLLGWALGHQGNFAASEAEFETAMRLNPGDGEILASYSAWASAFGGRSRSSAQSELSGMGRVELLLGILRCRSIRRRVAHSRAHPEKQVPLILLGPARRELRRDRAIDGSKGRCLGCANALPAPDHRGLHG
jgi:tetratricopeptide (TPR) repeat protein